MPAFRDVAIAAAPVLFGLVSLPAIDAISATDRPVDAGAALLVLVAAGAPAFRTRFPLATLIVVATASSAGQTPSRRNSFGSSTETVLSPPVQ